MCSLGVLFKNKKFSSYYCFVFEYIVDKIEMSSSCDREFAKNCED